MELYYLPLYLIVALLFAAKYQMKPARGDDDEDWDLALPFTRPLKITDPPIEGRDVMTLQNILRRYPGIELKATGVFDNDTYKALEYFQNKHQLLPSDGILDPKSAVAVLKELMSDNYKDDGTIPEGAKFKLHIPVYRDRTIETNATLFDDKGNVLHKFVVRTRGSTSQKGNELNQLTTNGNTPTGLSTMDLNSPEPIKLVKSFGPYPVLRIVKGIKGNSAIGRDNHIAVDGQETFLSNYRSGILVHTGIWDNWKPGQPMPNSNGCIHAYPEDQKIIVDLLLNIGVKSNENPFGKLPYPFKTQGIVSIEQLD